MTPLAAHFRSPLGRKEKGEKWEEEKWPQKRERERERERIKKGGDLSVGKLMTEMLLQRPAKNAPGCVNAAGKLGQK